MSRFMDPPLKFRLERILSITEFWLASLREVQNSRDSRSGSYPAALDLYRMALHRTSRIN